MKHVLAVATAAAVIAVALISGSYAQGIEHEKIIRVRGADSLARRIDGLSKIYVKDNPGVTVVVSGGARGTGVEGLLEGVADVAMAACAITDKERAAASAKGIELKEHLIGYGGLVFVTHPDNPVEEVTVDQIRKIFRGEITRWKEVGGPDQEIAVFRVGAVQHLGTITFVESDLIKGPITGRAEQAHFFPTVVKKVSQTAGSIGFTRVRDAMESPDVANTPFKILKVKKDKDSPSVMPSRQSIADGTYPIRRPWFLYTDAKNTKSHVKGFVDFILAKGWGSQQVK